MTGTRVWGTRRHERDAVEGGETHSIPTERSRRSETGDTLIEVLLAVATLGIISVAVLLGFATSIMGSAQYRSLATLDTVLRSAVAEATSQMQSSASSQTSSAFLCPKSATFQVVFQLPPGYTAQISSVAYWSGATWASTCFATSPQLITVAATYSGTTHSITSVVGDPLGRPVPPSDVATQLVFLAQPATGVSGSELYPSPVVAVEDAANHIVTSDLSPVTLTITTGAGPKGAQLYNCSGSEFYGVVTFSSCNISTAGKGYTLTATDRGMVSLASSPFDMTAGPASQLVFAAAPGPGTAGGPIPNVAVQVVDKFGNVAAAGAGAQVGVTIKSGGPQAGFNSGTTTANVSNGVATFPNLVVNTSGIYTFTASPIGISGVSGLVSSNPFAVTAAAVNSLALANPGDQTAGAGFGVNITALDRYGNTATSYAGTKTITLSEVTSPVPPFRTVDYPSSIVFTSGTGTAFPVTLYEARSTALIASDAGIAGGISPTFTVVPAWVYTGSVAIPGNVVAGQAFIITITALDAYGNTFTGANGITVAVGFQGPLPSPNGTGPILPANVTFTSGVATASITLFAAGDTTLITSAAGISGTSPVFTVAPAGVASVSVANPGTPTAGVAFNDAITALDAYGNGYTGTTPVAFSGPANSPNSSPTYPTTVSFTLGTATPSMTLVKAESTNLSATVAGITGTSTSFTVTTGGVSSMSVATPPTQIAGIPFDETITALDIYGNPYAGNTSVAFSGPLNSPNAATPSYPASVSFTSGVGTASVTLVNAQTTPGLTAAVGSVRATTPAFTVSPAGASSFSLTNPGRPTAGTYFRETITALDLYGNTATSYAAAVTVVLTGPVPSPKNNIPTPSVLVTFKSGVGTTGSIYLYAARSTTLTATQGSIVGTTASFDVAAAANTYEIFTTQPSGATAVDTAFPTAPVVTAEDKYGNTVDSSNAVTLTPYTTTTGTLGGCTSAVTEVHGVATFPGCSWSLVTTGVKVTATGGPTGLLKVTSAGFNITGVPSKLAFTSQPSTGAIAGQPFANQPAVSVEDLAGKTVTAAPSSSVTLSIGSGGAPSAVLSCDSLAVQVSYGVAKFTTCSIDKAGTTKVVLAATGGGLTTAVPGPSVLVTGPAATLAFTKQPVGGVSGAAFSTQPVVTILDAQGNAVAADAGPVNLAITGPTGATLTCTTNPKPAVSGAAAFALCSIDLGGTYTLTATDLNATDGPLTVTSSSFTET